MIAGLIYRAQLPDPERLGELLDFARTRAETRGWSWADAEPRLHLSARILGPDGQAAPAGSVRLGGVWLNPHLACDDLCLVFDEPSGRLVDPSHAGPDEAVLRDFAVTRTTWADVSTHAALIGLLEDLAGNELAAVEIGDPAGGEAAREPQAIASRLKVARAQFVAGMLERPEAEARIGGVIDLLAPAEARRRRAAGPGPFDRLGGEERGLLERAEAALLERWNAATPGLDGPPELAAAALERLTDLLLSHPEYRHDEERFARDFGFESGARLGSLLIQRFGGHWERVEGRRGPVLRVANLGGTGLTWRPLWSAGERLRLGPLYAPDGILGWLSGLLEDLEALRDRG